MTTLAAGLDYIDLEFLGHEGVIATAVLHDAAGVSLIDPGPSTSLPRLRQALLARGMAIADVRQVILTHIHLDHAGATGSLVKENPRVEVLVHERGARHLIDPAKLLASAARLYQEDMDRLWGEFLPVPANRVRPLAGGERIEASGRELQVAYTPGHASHHVSFLHEASGTAYCGDTAGVRIGPSGHVLAPTPPPDIDLEAWSRSIDVLAGWRPERLAVTHFGAWDDVDAQLGALREALERMVGWARELGDADAFAARVQEDIRANADPETAAAYEQGMPADTLYPGLERALRRVSSPQ
jgi:glyoxylase-like metal-dependent hydrolase (beta-lactamase superfamily II)